MWVFIMLAMFLVVLGSFFYVTRRISQFRFMEKVSKGRKWLRILESLVPVLAMFGVLWYTMGMMDALICMIHLVIICTDDHRCIACPQESAGRRQPGHLEIGFG